jgi:hypothetical protein
MFKAAVEIELGWQSGKFCGHSAAFTWLVSAMRAGPGTWRHGGKSLIYGHVLGPER